MLPSLGRRCRTVLLAGLVTAVLWTPFAVPTAAAASPKPEGPGPAMLMPRSDRLSALTCYEPQAEVQRDPVLLVPGTSMTAEENWGSTYLPVLRDRGHRVCWVDLPAYATRDVQANAEYVATAIRTMTARWALPISIIGHSQGAFLPLAALRVWPDLSGSVDDVIGLAGVYDHGSEKLARRCRKECAPVLHQLASGSSYLTSLRSRALPSGPSYTNIGTLGDLTVTPQPVANRQPGATSVTVEDVCPGRGVPEPGHAMIAGDAVALDLVLDALDHAGPSAPARLDPATCEEQYYPEFDAVAFLAAAEATGTRMTRPTRAEPALYCRSRRDCRDPRLRGFLVAAPRYTIGRARVTVRATALLHGRMRIVLGGRKIERTVRPGPVILQIRRPVRRTRLSVETRPRHYTAWAAEDLKWVRGRG